MKKTELKERTKPFLGDLPLAFMSLKNKETPIFAKISLIITTLYMFFPLDILPDALPFVGAVDDVTLIAAGIALVKKLVPEDIWQQNEEKFASKWYGNPKTWKKIAAVIIIAVITYFVLIILLIGKLLKSIIG